MKLLRSIVSSLPPAVLLVLQISCGGGDALGPGQAATMSANSSLFVTALAGAQVPELPSVLVGDVHGQPVAGVPVTFAVTGGGGTVSGATATTNASGIATVGGWTLGTGAGANTLTATTGGLPVVTFNACTTAVHTLGLTLDNQLALSDCKLSDGSFVDFYVVTLPTSGTYIFNQTSAAFDTYLALLTSTNTLIGVNDDFVSTSTDSRLKAIVPAGSYLIGANSVSAGATGNYSLASASSTEQVSNCEDVFVQPGITTSQSLQTTDCSASGFFSDEYVIYLTAGQSITVTMTSTVLDSYLEIWANGNPAILVFNDNIDATTQNAQVAFTAATTGFYIIAAASNVAGATGDYTFTIQ